MYRDGGEVKAHELVQITSLRASTVELLEPVSELLLEHGGVCRAGVIEVHLMTHHNTALTATSNMSRFKNYIGKQFSNSSS